MDDLKWDVEEDRRLIVEKYQKGREKVKQLNVKSFSLLNCTHQS
jgi:hypothetical protein